MNKIEDWLQQGGEIFVVQEGEGGHKISAYDELAKLVMPKHGDGLAEAVIIEKNGKSLKSTANEPGLDNLIAAIEKMIADFDK